MKKLFSRTLLLLTLSVSLFGCSNNNPETDEIITNNEESTIIKDAKSTDGYLEKKDYKSIAYAYIYKIKKGAKTYKSHTTGSVKAKVLFFDYDISFNSLTYKSGSTFYSKDHSVSSLMTVEGEYYMVDREKLLVGSGSDKYDVYTTEEYHKISYTVDQYMVMGYVFTDKSITNSELLEDKGDTVKIKYTLDNELGTHLVKKDFKNSGGLSEYPTFKKVNITLEMKRDFTPISYSIDSVYTASKAFLGSTEATQTSECLFSEVGSEVVIPNESFLSEKLGAEPSKIDTNDEEKSIKTELIEAFEKLDYQKGAQVNGTLSLNIMDGLPIELAIQANAFFDLSKVGEENIYNIIGLHAMLEADDNFGSLLSIVKMIAADKLGEYASLLDGFKKLEVVYDGEGELYLIPTNTEDATTIVGKIKLTDIINLVLKNVNLGSIVNTGTLVNADVTAELLKNLFYNKAPLHDGAVIIRDARIAAAGCVLPLTKNTNLSKDLGMRHRAGIGLSEESDAVVIIVSEESGAISLAIDGMLKRHLNAAALTQLLHNELFIDEEPKTWKEKMSIALRRLKREDRDEEE